ncbi:MAG: hypothetical protein AAF654_01815 [Myxococcota bacterium]
MRWIIVALALTGCSDQSSKEPQPAADPPTPTAAPEPVESQPAVREPAPKVSSPSKPDLSCETAADCAIKDVGNCCGYFPRCVNVDFKPDPAAVRRACEETGMMSTCGFVEISACECRAGKCAAANAGVGLDPR